MATAPKRRIVYKHSLDNPFKYKWPPIPETDLVKALEALKEFLAIAPRDPGTTVLKGISATTDHLQQNVFSTGPAGLLFLCKDDIRSPNLYNHLPMLAFLSHPQTILLTLPKGSKGQLKERFIPIECQATCVYIRGTSEEYEKFYKLIMEIQKPVQLPGVSRSLLQSKVHSRFVPAQIKTVRSSTNQDVLIKKGANKKAKKEKETLKESDNKTTDMNVDA